MKILYFWVGHWNGNGGHGDDDVDGVVNVHSFILFYLPFNDLNQKEEYEEGGEKVYLCLYV